MLMVKPLYKRLMAIGGMALGEHDQTRSPAFAPFARINIPSIDIGTLHREIGDNLLSERAHPNIALNASDFPKDLGGTVEGECLPRRKKRVCGSPGAVPHADDGRFVLILKCSDRCPSHESWVRVPPESSPLLPGLRTRLQTASLTATG